jgi:hypothetical protein
LPFGKLPYNIPCIKKNLAVDFAMILVIEVRVHHTLDVRGE